MTLRIYFLVSIYEFAQDVPVHVGSALPADGVDDIWYFALNEQKDIELVVKDRDVDLEVIFGKGMEMIDTHEVVSKKYINIYLKPGFSLDLD